MKTTRICPRCGAQLEADAPQGLCPACLLRRAEDSDTSRSGLANPPGDEALPGQRFGDYELLEEIARGGMGVVWRARQAGLNREVALKMILSGRFASEEEVRRFRTEAEAAAQLQHPNIVAIHEFGERDGSPYFTMDFVRGRSLDDVCAERPLPPERAASYLRTIAEAVHFAHQRGVVHRDLKPGNVLIDSNDEPRITDFGLAKMISRDSDLTLTGTVMGSPGYMAPEQAQGKSNLIGPRSDVYALGAILYEALTSRPPFRAATPLETMKQVVEAEPAAPSQVNPAVPRDLDTICLKCLEKDPARRFATACEFAEELDRFLRHEPIHSHPATLAERTRKWAKRKPAAAALVAVSALAFVGFVVGGLWFYGNLRGRLADTMIEQARLERRAGRRTEALAHIQNAASLRPDAALRAEAIQALAMPTMRRIFERTNGAISHLAFSPDGQRLAIGFETLPMATDAAPWTHEVSVWDIVTGAKLRRIDADLHAGTIAWSPDGRMLALPQADGTTALWEPMADKARAVVPETGSLVFSDDGTKIAVSGTNALQVFDATTGLFIAQRTNGVARGFAATNRLFVQIKEMLYTWDFAADRGWRVAATNEVPRDMTPDGRVAIFHEHAAGQGLDSIIARDMRTGKILTRTAAPAQRMQNGRPVWNPTFNARLSADGRRVAFFEPSDTAQLRMWDVEGDRFLANIRESRSMLALPFERIEMRRGSTSRNGELLPGPRAPWPTMVQPLSPDGRLFATSAYSGQNYCAVYELDTGTRIAAIPSAMPRCWSPDGRRLAVVTHGTATWGAPGGIRTGQSGDYIVEVWEVQNTRTEQRFCGAPRDLAFSLDGSQLAASGFLLQLESGARGPRFVGRQQEPAAAWIAFGPSNRIVSANVPGRASLWVGNVKFEQMQGGIRDLKDPLPYITGFGLAPDGRHLLVAGYRQQRVGTSSRPGQLQFQVWDLDTSERVQRWMAPTNAPDNAGIVAWSPDGRFIATTVFCEKGLDVWEVATGRRVNHLQCTEPGRTWGALYDFWNTRLRREPQFPYLEFSNAIEAMAFTPDSRLVISITYDRLFVREVGTGREVARHEFRRESVHHFALSPDGRIVAVVTHEGRVRLFDVATLKERAWWTAHEAAGESVAFSADGQTLATGAADGTLRLWHLPTLRAELRESGLGW